MLFAPPSLMSIISTAVTTVLCPLIVWAVQKLVHLLDQFTILEDQFISMRQEVKALQESDKASDRKLILLEEAITEISALRERTDEQFSEIKADLKQLPRILTLLEQYGQAIASSVPRNEVESRLRATEDRIRMVEQDIRTGKQK